MKLSLFDAFLHETKEFGKETLASRSDPRKKVLLVSLLVSLAIMQ